MMSSRDNSPFSSSTLHKPQSHLSTFSNQQSVTGFFLASYLGNSWRYQNEVKLVGSLSVHSVQELAKQSPAGVPTRYICNDLEPLDNDRSVEHRATINSTKERLSVATFQNPNADTEIGPIPSMITPETPALFRTIRYHDYLKKLFLRVLDGKKSFLDSMRIGEGDEDNNSLV